jgi:hypothetical protein
MDPNDSARKSLGTHDEFHIMLEMRATYILAIDMIIVIK